MELWDRWVVADIRETMPHTAYVAILNFAEIHPSGQTYMLLFGI